MSDAKFILVRDEKTKDQLEKSGFRLLRQAGNHWIFINDKSKNFSQINNVVYSNSLTF